ncbi:outer membrane protein [Commensalibacter papalotli (ex Servin-Garciduenas et al. 2014)]|uniref:Outer membrane protein n=2 Tax=Commensalibacter papalotli (ex Servin-Garciduenas et al. 2014) TaxID=1208583 RepID=W7DMB3_9PROT|nr:outer membrane protein [Commensalibacter papalotli (ex Servin-Garciduenas et al. 2014)]
MIYRGNQGLLFIELQLKYYNLLNKMNVSKILSRVCWGVTAGVCSSIYTVLAADPQTYRVEIRPTGNADIDATLSDVSNLVTLKKTKAVGSFALSGRIKSDYERLQSAMDSFGYYDAKIKIEIGNAEAVSENKEQKKKKKKDEASSNVKRVTNLTNTIDGNNPDLPNFIGHIPDNQDAVVVIHIDKGNQYHLGKIELVEKKTQQQVEPNNKSTNLKPQEISKTITLTDDQQKAFALKSGQPAASSDVVAAKGRLLTSLREDGHALAKINDPVAYLRPDTKTLDIVYEVQPGPIVDLGDIEFKGLEKVHEDFIRKRLLLSDGQLYQPSKIESARQDLSSLGVFSSIDATAGTKLDANGRLPLLLTFKEAKRRSVSFEAGYSTDLGGRLGVRWSHKNLFGNAEKLNLVALATGLGGTAQKGIGYDIYADFTKPDFKRRDQELNARIEAVKQNLYSYDQTAFLIKAGLNRKINKHWRVSGYLGAIQEHIIQRQYKNDYSLLNVPLGARYDNTDLASPMMSPTHGMKASVLATPTVSFGDGTIFFAILEGSASTYFDLAKTGLTKPGDSVFAFRGTVGSIQGASRMNLPPDQRMYAGGTSTVRGFRFQGVGPQFHGTKYAVGGKAMDAGTVEFRQKLTESFGTQAFMDAGQVSKTSMPFEGDVRVGVGAGVKYYTPLGPIRFDIAVPVNRPPRGDKFEVYISLGETF